MGRFRCQVCGKKHERYNRHKFPKDFPNEWKFCYLCNAFARELVNKSIDCIMSEYNIIDLVDEKEQAEYIKRLTKLSELIILV